MSLLYEIYNLCFDENIDENIDDILKLIEKFLNATKKITVEEIDIFDEIIKQIKTHEMENYEKRINKILKKFNKIIETDEDFNEDLNENSYENSDENIDKHINKKVKENSKDENSYENSEDDSDENSDENSEDDSIVENENQHIHNSIDNGLALLEPNIRTDILTYPVNNISTVKDSYDLFQKLIQEEKQNIEILNEYFKNPKTTVINSNVKNKNNLYTLDRYGLIIRRKEFMKKKKPFAWKFDKNNEPIHYLTNPDLCNNEENVKAVLNAQYLMNEKAFRPTGVIYKIYSKYYPERLALFEIYVQPNDNDKNED